MLCDMMEYHRRNTLPHPVASAFFDAYDVELERRRTAATSSSLVDVDDDAAAVATSTSASPGIVSKARASLGWRTRYSSSQLYPVTIRPVGERRLRRSRRRPSEVEEDSENELASFHVRQVFPRDRGNIIFNVVQCHDYYDDHDHECDDSEQLGTGATVWPGSIVLLRYLEKLAHDPNQINVLAGKVVADLGSGTAITSIGSALLGANVVVCTDGCDPVVDLAKRNIQDAILHLGWDEEDEEPKKPDERRMQHQDQQQQYCTCRGCKMIARKYLWGEGMEMEGIVSSDDCDCSHEDVGLLHQHQIEERIGQNQSRHQFDVILGADCIIPRLYSMELLVKAIDELSSSTTVSYLSYEQRHYEHYDPAVEFRRLAKMRCLDVEVVPHDEMHPMYHAEDIQIWRLKRNNNEPCCCQSENSIRQTSEGRTVAAFHERSERRNHLSLLVG